MEGNVQEKSGEKTGFVPSGIEKLKERAQGALIGGRITIEDKAWIAGDVKIMTGVTIGEGAVIGCGSIVTHDIPPRVVAAGNPCRVIRQITDADKVGFVK